MLPAGFHRIRYYDLLASGKRAENVARARELLLIPPPVIPIDAIKAINFNPETRIEKQEAQPQKRACPCCGGTTKDRLYQKLQRFAEPNYRKRCAHCSFKPAPTSSERGRRAIK